VSQGHDEGLRASMALSHLGGVMTDDGALTIEDLALVLQQLLEAPREPKYPWTVTCPKCGRRWTGLVVGHGEPPQVTTCQRCERKR